MENYLNLTLCYALDKDLFYLIKDLINKGADIELKNKDGDTALIKIIKKLNSDIIDLINTGADDIEINSICYGEYFSIIKFLINKGANLNAKGKDGTTSLNWALKYSYMANIAKLLINNGADVNTIDEFGNLALINAAKIGDFEIAKSIIDKNADINLALLETINYMNRNIKYKYSLNGNIQLKDRLFRLIELLIENGADLNACDEKGHTVLMHAISFGDRGIVKYLINQGANVNSKSKNGGTVLAIALLNGDKGIKRILLDNGAQY